MIKSFLEMLQNRYGKYSLSKVVPFLWFVYLLIALTFKFDWDMPPTYFNLTLLFSTVYIGKTAVDKMKDFTKTTPPAL